MFGLLNIPYCWAAKSTRKEAGAIHFAVLTEMPIFEELEVLREREEVEGRV